MTGSTLYNTVNKSPRIKWLVIACFIAAVLAVLPVIINAIIERTIKEKLKALPRELTISFSAIHSNILSTSISFTNLHIQLQPYKQISNHYDLYTGQFNVNGIAFLRLLLNKTISVNNLQTGKTEIILDSLLLSKKDSAQTALFDSLPVSFNKINIHRFAMQETSVWIKAGNKLQLLTKGVLEMNDILLDNVQAKNTREFRFAGVICLLKELHYNSPSSGYALNTGSITINSKTGTLVLNTLQLIKSFHSTNNTYQVSTQIHKLELKNWDVHSLMERELTADSLLVDENKLYIREAKNGTLADKPVNTPGSGFEIPFAVNIKNINIHHSEINFGNVFKAEGNVTISNLRSKGGSIAVSSNNIHLSAINAVYNHVTFYTGIPTRVVQVKGIVLDSRQGYLQANEITVHTIYSKQQLATKLGYQADWIDASVKRISLQNPDINTLLHSRLVGDKLELNGIHLYVYRDRRLPRRKVHQPMPADLLKQIPGDIRIHTVEVNEAYIEYEETPVDGFKDGTLRVQNIHASVSPFINHPQSNDPGYAHIYTTASLMGSGTISSTIDIPLKQNVYYVKGAIQNLDLTALNSSAENLGKFHIQSGMLNNLLFNFSFNATRSNGKIIGEYHDLIVQKLNKKRKEALLPSLVLRYIIIPKNKDKARPVARRTGRINYTRDDTRFIAFFLVKSLLTGIRSSFTFGFLLPE